MTRLVWGVQTERTYESGVSYGVLYPPSGPGVVWNGLVTVSESSDGPEETVSYYDGERYSQRKGVENYSAEVEAFTYPDELDLDGSFGFSYRVQVGESYQVHLVYNASFDSSEVTYVTQDETADPSLFKWSVTTVPELLPNRRPTAHIIIDLNKVTPTILAQIETIMYGADISSPRMPGFGELLDIFEAGAIFKITDHGDGTWTATGPDDMIEMIDSTTFKITSPSAVYRDSESYRVSSW